jgi:DNA replication and repair protein RecF
MLCRAIDNYGHWMQINRLSLTNFRSFARLDIDVPGGPVLLVGGNAQGKTTLLEAIYFLATFTSFHATSDRQLISFFVDRDPLAVGRIVADYSSATDSHSGSAEQHAGGGRRQAGLHRLEVRLIREMDPLERTQRFRKEILLDGVTRKTGEAMGAFNAVLFLPHMLRIIDGAPEERRRYLNLAMGQVDGRYSANLAEYQRVLTQRNALLKALGERGGDTAQLLYWDEQLAHLGAEIMVARIRAVSELERLAARLHRDLTRGQEVLRLDYQPAFEPLEPADAQAGQYILPLAAPKDRSGLSVAAVCQGFQERLVRLRGEEIARGVTTIGPHRDELRFLGNGIDLGIYGSRGQGRTAVLALKLAEVAWMKEKTGQWPVLLLDEVLAELDQERRADLLNRLLQSEQALLTTTDMDLFSPEYVQKARLWYIHAGHVSEDPVSF